MNILYIKKSYEKLYKNRCIEYRKTKLGKNIQISELILNAKYIDKIFNIKNNNLKLEKKLNRLKKDNKNIQYLTLNIKHSIFKYSLSLKLLILNTLINREFYKNKLVDSKYILSVNLEQDEYAKIIIKNILYSSKNKFEEFVNI